MKQFDYRKGVANIFVIDRRGRTVKQMTGSISDAVGRELTTKIDRATSGMSEK